MKALESSIWMGVIWSLWHLAFYILKECVSCVPCIAKGWYQVITIASLKTLCTLKFMILSSSEIWWHYLFLLPSNMFKSQKIVTKFSLFKEQTCCIFELKEHFEIANLTMTLSFNSQLKEIYMAGLGRCVRKLCHQFSFQFEIFTHLMPFYKL